MTGIPVHKATKHAAHSSNYQRAQGCVHVSDAPPRGCKRGRAKWEYIQVEVGMVAEPPCLFSGWVFAGPGVGFKGGIAATTKLLTPSLSNWRREFLHGFLKACVIACDRHTVGASNPRRFVCCMARHAHVSAVCLPHTCLPYGVPDCLLVTHDTRLTNLRPRQYRYTQSRLANSIQRILNPPKRRIPRFY